MYIDPGSSSMLIQAMSAGAFGLFITFRKAIFGFFSRLRSAPANRTPKDAVDSKD